jgi:phosphatidylinositol alpha-1,6-mannosyltransferase
MPSDRDNAATGPLALATQCFGPDLGGIETLMTGLADALAASGREIEVFADHIRWRNAGELVRPYPIRRFGSIRPVRRWMKRRALAERAKSGFTGVFADSWKSVAAVPRDVGPIVALAHGTEYPEDPGSQKARRIAAALARVRAVVASSQFTADRVAPYLKGGPPKITVVNPPLSALADASPTALAEIGAIISGRRPIIATLARLEPRKGVDAVIAALPSLRARYPDLVYLVAGAGADLARLRALAAERGVTDAVVFLGPVTEPQRKAALLTLSDVYAMPSRRVGDSVEGFGIAYAEAAWYGRPSLAGADGGASEIVKDGVSGLVCDGRNWEAVSQALFRLLDDDQARARMGAAGSAFVRARLSWAAALPRYLAALGL